MGHETLIKEGNPIFQAAEQLRSIVKTSVQENLQGIFPKNYEHEHGDYNLIFVVSEGHGNIAHGFYSSAKMVVLTPEGDIKSGQVEQDVGNWSSCWKFRGAELRKASDLEVVRHTPQLVKNLFEQLEDELSEEESPQKIINGINYIFNNKNLYMQTLAISYKALKEMGEEDPNLVHEDSGQPEMDLAEIIKAFEEQNPQYKIARRSNRNVSIEQKKAAIDLFANKQNLIDELRVIASNMRAPLVEKRVGEVVREMIDKNIFPITWKDEEEVGWFGNKDIGFQTLHGPIYSKGRHKGRVWCVSVDGQVREFQGNSSNASEPYFCAEHLLEQAPEIMKKLMDEATKNFFRKIKI